MKKQRGFLWRMGSIVAAVVTTMAVVLSLPGCVDFYPVYIAFADSISVQYGNEQGAREAISAGANLEWSFYRDRDDFSVRDRNPVSIAANNGSGNGDITQLLLDAGASPNVTGDRGKTLLMQWILSDAPLYEQLLSAGADVNACGKGEYEGKAPVDVLLQTDWQNDQEIGRRLEQLLQHGLVIQKQTMQAALQSIGVTHYTTMRKAVQSFLQQGGSLQDDLMQAAVTGDVVALLEAAKKETDGARLNIASCYVAAFGDVPSLQELCGLLGHSVRWMQDLAGNSLLQIAAQYNSLDMVKWLWQQSPELMDKKNIEDENPLSVAVYNADPAVFSWLVGVASQDQVECLALYDHLGEKGQQQQTEQLKNSKQISDQAVQHIMTGAACNNRVEYLSWLFDAFPQFDPNMTNESMDLSRAEAFDYQPLLYTACDETGLSPEIARCLIEHGANVDGKEYLIPVDIAVKRRNVGVVQVLVNAGCQQVYNDPLQNGDRKTSALAQAIHFGSLDIVRFLIEVNDEANDYEQLLKQAKLAPSREIEKAIQNR